MPRLRLWGEAIGDSTVEDLVAVSGCCLNQGYHWLIYEPEMRSNLRTLMLNPAPGILASNPSGSSDITEIRDVFAA